MFLLLCLPLFTKFLPLAVSDCLTRGIVSRQTQLVKLAKLVCLVSEHLLRSYCCGFFTSSLHVNNGQTSKEKAGVGGGVCA